MCQIKTKSSLTSNIPSDNIPESPRKKLMVEPRMRVVSPFRRVAKTARVNLNNFWGLLSSKMGPTALPPMTPSTSVEEEENRLNELIEAAALAETQNELNSSFEISRRGSVASSSSYLSLYDSDVFETYSNSSYY